MKAVLLDIEGTTTPLDFVHKTLLPYSRERIDEFVQADPAGLSEELRQLVAEAARDREYNAELVTDEPLSVSAYLKFLIDHDRKSTPLKSIQGRIWKRGYESGELVAPVFEDVQPALERWKKDKVMIAIFSSGSVLAQQLLFRHTDHGDLTQYLSNYFDTNIGQKRSSQSYAAISRELKVDVDEIVFVSDVVEELDAARSSRMMTALAVRPGNPAIEEDVSHRIITTFDELD